MSTTTRTNPEDILAAKAGDQDAQARLLDSLRGYIIQQASRWPGEREDLIQECSLAILEALSDLDVSTTESVSGRFASLARIHTTRALEDFQAQGATVVTHRSTYSRVRAALRATGSDSEAEAYAAAKGMAPETFRAALTAMAGAGRLVDEEGEDLLDTSEVESITMREGEEAADAADRRRAWELLETLPPHLAEVVSLYYGMTSREPLLKDEAVGARLGISRATAQRRRTEAEALLKGVSSHT